MRSGGVKTHLQNSEGRAERRAAAYEAGGTGEAGRNSAAYRRIKTEAVE